MKFKTVIGAFTALSLSGCGSLPQDRALSGSAIGAGAGAIIGAVTGLSVAQGALIGAAAGAVTGLATDAQQVNLGEPRWKKRAIPTPLSALEGQSTPLDSQVINSIQTSLNRLGYRAGPVDGVFGTRTAMAIRAYQRDHNLREDGRPSPRLADHLWSRGRSRAVGSAPLVQGSTS